MTDDAPGVPVAETLARRLRQLSHGETLTIAESGDAGIRHWEIRRGTDGIARPWFWPVTPSEPGAGPRPRGIEIDGIDGWLPTDASLDDLLRDVLRYDPLTLWYELAVKHRTEDDFLDDATIPLFPRGARSGDKEQFPIRCEPADAGGTAFAVLGRDQMLSYQVISIQSAVLPPGSYDLTAELVRPGRVRFTGLPASLHPEPRALKEILRDAPDRLPRPRPAHLAIAIEFSGDPQAVRERIGRARQLVRSVSGQPHSPVTYSLLHYGPHAVHRSEREVPVAFLCGEAAAADALDALRWLADQPPPAIGYPEAAQVECMLAAVAKRLGGPVAGQPRNALVTIGARPAFPRRINLSRVIPCRSGDWRAEMFRLQRHPGITFGAIRDRGAAAGPEDEVWQHLGATAFAWLDTVDVPAFAADLGLLAPAGPPVPVPLDQGDGA